jgi:uncharacterized protein YlxP (DUF503 family)
MAVIANDTKYVRQLLDKASKIFDQYSEAEVNQISIEIL